MIMWKRRPIWGTVCKLLNCGVLKLLIETILCGYNEGRERIFLQNFVDQFLKFPSYCKIFLTYIFVSGDIGGNMSLFLGCSLLTLFEFVHLLWNFLTFRANRVKHVKGKPQCNSDSGEVWDINSDQVKIVRCTFIQI